MESEDEFEEEESKEEDNQTNNVILDKEKNIGRNIPYQIIYICLLNAQCVNI